MGRMGRMGSGGDWLPATDELAGPRGGGHAVLGDHLTGDDRGDVAVGGLIESAATGGQVVGDHRLVDPQRRVVDDVEVGLVTHSDATAVTETGNPGRHRGESA